MKKIIIVMTTFFLDRISKIYLLNLQSAGADIDFYVFPFLNFYLIWNKGIAFGLFSFDQNFIYNLITFLIVLITVIILIVALRSKDYKGYFFIIIFSGSVGNLYDRFYYSAVPDFIDFHINDFHWFIFNVADVFISVGVICLIIAEFIFNKTSKK